MDPRLLVHNTHREGIAAFRRSDPHLRRLAGHSLVWEHDLLDRLPREDPGVYTLGGARQVGKSTLLKQWMLRLMRAGQDPRGIAFFSGELIDDHHVLHRLLSEALEEAQPGGLRFLLVDEVSYIKEWDRAVKFLADAGALERAVVLLTGSDLGLIRDVRTFLPGRRGPAAEVDFHLHPLTWLETCALEGSLSRTERELLGGDEPADFRGLTADAWDRCWRSLDEYLVHGGFLTALNDLYSLHTIRPATLATYSDWIRGDILKRGKNEAYLREVLAAICERLGSHVSWNALAKEMSIDHPATVAGYVDLLERMDAVFVQKALREDRLTGAPKKARKLAFADPFILHAVRAWLEPTVDPYGERIRPFLTQPDRAAAVVESVVAAHARRRFATYYIKAAGEVDVAIVSGRQFFPIEVKWRTQLRPSDLKQIAKYDRGRIVARTESMHEISGVPVVPLPRALALLGKGVWPPPESSV
jgi:hypothetical protein